MAVALAASFASDTLTAQATTGPRPDVVRPSSIGLDYTYQNFRGDIDPWHLVALTAGRRTSRGSIIGRINYADRFASDGVQVEADAYPRLGDGLYAYLNLGYSRASIFPGWRSGAELFGSLPHAYEASLGYRQLRFGGPPVTLLTGSVGKYVGNHWFSLRPYIRSKATGTSGSASFTARRYFQDGDNWLGGRIGVGSTPGDQLVQDQTDRTSSFGASIQGSRTVQASLVGTWSAGYDSEQLGPRRARTSLTVSTGLKYLF